MHSPANSIYVFQFCLPGELPVSNLHILNGGLLIAHMPDLLSACMELRTGGGQTQASVLNCSFGGDNWLVECFMSRQSQLRPRLLEQTRITWAETNREPLPGKRQMSVYTVHFQLSQQNTEWLQKRAVKCKSHTIELYSGAPQKCWVFFVPHGRHFDQIPSLLSFANNDSRTISVLYCVIHNLCSRPRLKHPFVTAAALNVRHSYPVLPRCIVLASTHVVNGMMVCRPLSAVRGGEVEEGVDTSPSRLK